MVSQMGQFLAELDSVLASGVTNISKTVNTTLDRLNQLVDHVLHAELFDATGTSMMTQVDDVIGTFRYRSYTKYPVFYILVLG